MNISFAGCGFLGIYHIGVASCFREHAPHLINKISGASAGALLGTLLVCDDVDLGVITEDVLKTASKARARSLGPFHPGFNIHQILEEGMVRVLPEDIHRRASGRLFISLTRMSDRQNVIVSEFKSKRDLMDALLCSAFIPFYSGFLPPTFRGTRYVDGGISDNLPIVDHSCKTITVSPLSGEADICPRSEEFSDYLNFTLSNTNVHITPSNLYRMCRALYPPEPSVLSRMCKQGFEDALVYLKTHTLIPCERHVLHRSHSVCLGDTHMSRPKPPSAASRRRSLRPVQSQSTLASEQWSKVNWFVPESEEEEERDEERDETDHGRVVFEEEDDEEEDDRDVPMGAEACNDEGCDEGNMWEDWDDNDFFENRTCERCERNSQKLKLVKSLPPEVMEVLHSACQSLKLKPSLWNYITRSHVGQMASLASLPLILPIESAFSIAIRLTRWLPHLPSDLRWFLSGLNQILQLIASNLDHVDISKFEAQFSCNFGLQVEPEHMSALAGYPSPSQGSSEHAHELQALDIAAGQPRKRKFNFQFSMDVEADTLPDCIIDTFDFCDDLGELSIPRRERVALEHRRPAPDPQDGAEYDNFDYTLKVRKEMDDVLTYHYLHISQQVDRETGQGSVEIVEL